MRLNKRSWLKKKPDTRIPDGKEELWAYTKNLVDTGIEARRPWERRWIINLAFLGGHQYSFFNKNAHALQQLRRKKGRVRNVDNLLLPKWRRQIADLIKNDPVMSVVPNTNENEDIKAARAGDKAMKHFWRQNKMKKKLRLLAGWIFSAGNGFLDDRWDPKSGPTEINPDTGKLEYMGDVTCGVWSPFEIIVPFASMSCDELQQMPWIAKAKWRDLYWLEKHYGKEALQVTPESMADSFINLAHTLGMPGTTMPEENVPGAMHIQLYMRPNYKFKKGLFVSAANGKILVKDDYPFDIYHLEHFKDIDMPGVFWGKATTEEAIPLQKNWNRANSSVDEFNRTMGKGKWMAPRGAGLTADPDDSHGEVIYYKPIMGYKPEQLNIKSLPPTYTLQMEVTRGSLDDLYSQHEVSRGTNKSDIRSGEMVALLREQDAHGNIPAHAVFEESLESVMSRVLKRMQEGYTNERMLRVLGREGEWDIEPFKGSDLRNNTDVSVKQQSSLPDSRVAREARILEKFGQGLYGDPMDPEVRRHVMNMLDDAVVKDIYADTRLDEAYARWENMQMMQDQQAYLINKYDNHQIHVREHNHHRKSMEYQRHKVENPQGFMALESAFEAHVNMHNEFLQEMEKQQIAKMAALKETGNDTKRS